MRIDFIQWRTSAHSVSQGGSKYKGDKFNKGKKQKIKTRNYLSLHANEHIIFNLTLAFTIDFMF